MEAGWRGTIIIRGSLGRSSFNFFFAGGLQVDAGHALVPKRA